MRSTRSYINHHINTDPRVVTVHSRKGKSPAQTTEIVAETTANRNLPIKETFIVTNWRNKRPTVFRK